VKRLSFSIARLIFGSFLVLGCSQTKDTFINRNCHNLSAHYNGYYNAGLKIEEGKEKLAESHTDSYDRILRVFPYANAEKSKAVYPQMDDAIKRLSTSISKHTMYDKRGNEKPGSEHWIDDNWILWGQAMFFKHEYFQAMDAFKYVEATYKTEPGRYLASLWIAKTYLELTQLNEAETKLDYLRNTPDFPKKNRWELEATAADFYVQVKNYPKAIEHLKVAAEKAPKREDRLRFLYILGQLNQALDQYPEAFAIYSKVIKMNPKYEMAFNARINRARCFDAGSGSSKEVLKELDVLAKDPKNKDFLDQIYYAHAGIAKKEGRQEDEIAFLNKSIQASTTNKNQKALSYLELAKISFEKPEYKKAQLYYDSVVTNLANDYPDYSEILQRRNSLTKLVRYLNTIAKEDSLQQLAKLSPEEQQKVALEQIKKKEEEAKKKKELEQQQQPANQIFGSERQGQANQFNQQGGSNWYFYNAQAISFGFNEFVKRWGNRPLEDNWRRSNKESVAPAVEEEEETATADTSKAGDKEKAKNPEEQAKEMVKIIPSTPEALEKSTTKIIDAYYNAAMLYREQFNDFKSSIQLFEELLSRYPKNKYEPQSYYQLYRMCQKMGDTQKEEYYKNLIFNQYPNSDYAMIIKNPDYASQMAARKSEAEVFYEETYRKYLNAEYATVIQRRNQALLQFPENTFMPQFDLLRALCIGRTQPLPQFEASLNDVVRMYPENPVKEQAQQILEYIKGAGGAVAQTPPAPVADPNDKKNKRAYAYMPDTTHFVVIVFQNIGGPVDGNRLKTKLSNFNATNYSSKALAVQDLLLDHRYKILVIRELANKADAMRYNDHLYNNDDVYGNINPDGYKQFAISANNLPELLKQKKTDEYEEFFRSFYK
jgi:tetratricopeptide (TPR) repeat protein